MYTSPRILVLCIVIAVIGLTGRSTAKPVVITADHQEQECVHKLGQKLDTCLAQFDSQLGFYKRLLTTDQQRNNMQASLCQDYQEALMCVHQELVKCEDSRNHLDTVQKRLGAVREFMIHVCAAASRSDTDTAKTSRLVTPSTTSIPAESTTEKLTTTKPRQTASVTKKANNLNQDDTQNVKSNNQRKTVAAANKLPSSEQIRNHQKAFAAASSQQKTVKDKVGSILDCLKNKQNNISACVEYYFSGAKNSARNFQSTSKALSFLLVAFVLLL